MSFTKKEGLSSLIRLHLEVPVAAGLGDKGILRRYSPQDLIGGVTLLGPAERNHKHDDQLVLLKEGVRRREFEVVMFELLQMSKEPPNLKEWTRLAGYAREITVVEAVSRLVESGKVKKAGSYYIGAEQVKAFQIKMKKVLQDFHRQRPEELGISRETLRQKIKLPQNVVDWFIQDSIHAGLALTKGEFVAAPSHAQAHGQNIEQLKEVFEKMMNPSELIEVTPQWLTEKMQRSPQEIKPFFDLLIREGVLIRLSGVHVYRKTIQYIGAVIQAHFTEHATLSAGELRDRLNTSRRLAIPILEYFDAHKYTVRKEDVRYPGPNLGNLSE